LMRRDLEQIVAGVSALRTHGGATPDIGMTTNGLGLDKRAAALRRAGLGRVNVSIDSLDPQDYAALTRRDRLDEVLEGIAGAQAAGLSPIKVNAVALPGTVGRRAPQLLHECLRRGWQLRFIEHMPLGPASSWRRGEVVVAEEILDSLRAAGFTLEEAGRPDRRPAALWRVRPGADHPGGTVGIIASVSAPFCADCDRTRITADGRLMTCLFSATETDLRGPMRAGADDEEIMRIWAQATWLKPRAHGCDDAPSGDPAFSRPRRTMSAIGG
ncbi:MAG: radical SAM protein, partial [Actinomyces bowdenii]|nr:radical SAM protein [Actinomyces bowdenii]